MKARTRIMLKFFVPQRRKPDPKHAIPEADKDLAGKTIVFTGGTDGMGRMAAEMLHDMGAKVILPGRNRARGEAVVQELTEGGKRGAAHFEACDLSSMQSVHDCAHRILAQHKQIDFLVNCAGAHIPERKTTLDGFEMNFAINFLGPYLLTHLLQGRIEESAPARIVNLVTDVEWLDHLELDDLQSEQDFNATDAYTKGKLAMQMLTVALGERFAGKGVTTACLNPGFIQSNLLRNQTGLEAAMQSFMRKLASPTVVGADRVMRVAASSEYRDVIGAYVYEDTIRAPHPDTVDKAKREKLMQLSEKAVSKWI